MRYLLLALTLIQLITSCNDSKPKVKKENIIVKSEDEIIQNRIELIEKGLRRDDFEKINLLAEYNKIHVDSLISIIRDYLELTSKSTNPSFSKEERYKSSFEKLNQRYKLSKKKLAGIIFSYQYEMITREEIEESAIEDYMNSNEIEDDPLDQRDFIGPN
ncbi:MAG: hypothetical protein IPO72_04075 [Saprospiraceae bacterium]|nr:hypothetical protein [Candidatus Vicinibacter affinis]MBK7694748.1 hypothetical protein [Candidatus Vicinibacter affinis]MBK9640474.1 hypothetical protein [Candidatus Vicinibacter affinis]HQX44969.1 hypothetical protein [Saprospiraceae bacterium]